MAEHELECADYYEFLFVLNMPKFEEAPCLLCDLMILVKHVDVWSNTLAGTNPGF